MVVDQDITEALLTFVPLYARRFREQFNSLPGCHLTIPQFYILEDVHRGNRQINTLAKHHGIGAPAMSKSVEAMVRRKLLIRDTDSTDRRQRVLSLTKKGEQVYLMARRAAEDEIQNKINNLKESDFSKVVSGLNALKAAFEEN